VSVRLGFQYGTSGTGGVSAFDSRGALLRMEGVLAGCDTRFSISSPVMRFLVFTRRCSGQNTTSASETIGVRKKRYQRRVSHTFVVEERIGVIGLGTGVRRLAAGHKHDVRPRAAVVLHEVLRDVQRHVASAVVALRVVAVDDATLHPDQSFGILVISEW
jgi:hypothetical protein